MVGISHQLTAQEVYFQFKNVFTVGDGNGEFPLLGEVASGTFDKNGNLYLLDNVNKQIHKYDPNGSFIMSFGREGRGPGEFLRATESIIYDEAESSVYIVDYVNARIVGYDAKTGDHINTRNLQSTNAIPLNNLISFNEGIFLLGSHQKRNDMIHQIDSIGETILSFGEFIDFNSFRHNSNGKQQLSQVHGSKYNGKLLVGLAAPNRVKLYDEELNLIREFEDDNLPKPWVTHMTMEPGRYRATFYSMSVNNQILSEKTYLYHWIEVVDPEGPVLEHYLELRSLEDGEIIHKEKMNDMNIINIHRKSDSRALLFIRDSSYNYKVYELVIGS